MPVGDILRIVPVTMLGTQLGLNVRYYRISATVAPEPDRAAIAAFFDGLLGPLYQAAISGSAQYQGTMVQREFPLPRSVVSVSSTAAGPGGLIGDDLPTQVAGLVTFRTAMAGRKFRGRMYLPFATESVNTAGHAPSVAYLASIAAIGSFFASPQTVVSGGGSASMLPVIYHRTSHTSDDITGGQTRSHWATQRRRGDLGRPNVSPIG